MKVIKNSYGKTYFIVLVPCIIIIVLTFFKVISESYISNIVISLSTSLIASAALGIMLLIDDINKRRENYLYTLSHMIQIVSALCNDFLYMSKNSETLNHGFTYLMEMPIFVENLGINMSLCGDADQLFNKDEASKLTAIMQYIINLSASIRTYTLELMCNDNMNRELINSVVTYINNERFKVIEYSEILNKIAKKPVCVVNVRTKNNK